MLDITCVINEGSNIRPRVFRANAILHANKEMSQGIKKDTEEQISVREMANIAVGKLTGKYMVRQQTHGRNVRCIPTLEQYQDLARDNDQDGLTLQDPSIPIGRGFQRHENDGTSY
ncbi:hypothetical protein LTS07_002055 [Exophiala sideris]|uniref:Uncharacterized protein n=1 Tax=Exophiala sideris TaxID=1016849 RepID=A0ABR0JL93_9EURO|nr:hypothetical protein LTS07_002055 [Exophiala sideris]KAK5066712.1 hypothetical protein LTR69_002059 [Exophiala sideris]KAK5184770.1 hypothetical protein LTR44_002616 [Eurotiomycetes sp. CCFEE 6388]